MLQSRIFVGMVLILIFGEVLGLYGYCDCLRNEMGNADQCQAHRSINLEYGYRLKTGRRAMVTDQRKHCRAIDIRGVSCISIYSKKP